MSSRVRALRSRVKIMFPIWMPKEEVMAWQDDRAVLEHWWIWF